MTRKRYVSEYCSESTEGNVIKAMNMLLHDAPPYPDPWR